LSGIAPFAQSVPVDDPSVRAEIMKLANLTAPTNETPAPATEKPPAPAPAVEIRKRVETSARAVEPTVTIPSRETADMTPPVPEMLQRVAEPIAAAPMKSPAAAYEVTPIPRETAPAVREVEAPLAKSSRANPYFFRDQEEDDEELLLTIEMNDSAPNAHRLVPAAQRATSTASSHGGNEPYLGPTRNSDTGSMDAEFAPNQMRAVEESPKPVVDPMPWPSISERRLGAPIPAKEHGTGTPPRRSWWRRSIGHNS
jgi:hypothetical protein